MELLKGRRGCFRAARWGFDLGFCLARAFLEAADGSAACAELERILANRGLERGSNGFEYPMAFVYLARAATLEGKLAKSHKAYQDFFALWKDADLDIPILKEARPEFEKKLR
ncbi:MAG: hypothetical protein ABIG68_06715 [Acidobacteriota bacterium]